MKKYFFLCLFLTSACAYHNPLDTANFRFQTLNTPPYILSSWYHIDQKGEPLSIYVEKKVLDEEMRELAVQDTSSNVAYIARPCQYFQTSVCTETVSDSNSKKAIQSGIDQLKKKAGTNNVSVKGLE